MPGKTKHNSIIIAGMAKYPWAIYWADREEEKGKSFSGENLCDICPKTPRKAIDWAKNVADLIVKDNEGRDLDELFVLAQDYGFAGDEEDFGGKLGAQASGTGIRWDDDINAPKNVIKVPQREFYL